MRKTAEIVLDKSYGRDADKAFLITEMPSVQGEDWVWRTLSAAAHSGIKVNPDGGWAQIAITGIQALMGMPFGELKPLLEELMGCVQIKTATMNRALTPDDIEEITTRLRLKDEVIKLHTGFSPAATLFQVAALWTPEDQPSSTTQTSEEELAPSSRPAKQRSTNSKRSMA